MRVNLVTVCVVFAALIAVPVRATDKLSAEQLEALAQVKAALRCEANGDSKGRQAALRRAIDVDPECESARWQLGHLRNKEGWLSIPQLQLDNVQQARYRAYDRLRAKHSGTVAGELKLARWCRNRRPDAARLHYGRLLNIRVSSQIRSEAIRRLDLKDVGGGVLLTSEQVARQKEQYKQAKANWTTWRPIIERWQRSCKGGLVPAEVEQEMVSVVDQGIVPVAEAYAPNSRGRFGVRLLKLLSRFENHQGTRALAAYALFSQALEVREAAIERLRPRPLHEFVPLLMSCIEARVESRWKVVNMSDGTVRYIHEIYQEGATGNRHLVSTHHSYARFTFQPTADPRRTSVTTWTLERSRDHHRYAQERGERVQDLKDKAAKRHKKIAQANRVREMRNKIVYAALEKTTKADVEESPTAWWNWWASYNELEYEKGTRTYHTQSKSRYGFYNFGPHYRAMSCFVAGTPVVAEAGDKRIEEIRPGDRVLAQDPETGEIAFKLVVSTTVRPPAPILRLTINGNPIDTTAGHPFWVIGKGWRMAKLLQQGDRLHGAGGPVLLERIEDLPNKRAYNLVVDEFNSYFVGDEQVLVHDNTFRRPTRSVVPGLPREK